MNDDEQAIRAVVRSWMEATKAGNTQAVLSLMTGDAVFMVPGAEPFGTEAFEAAAKEQKQMDIDGTAEVVEIEVFGDTAYTRTHIDLTMTGQDGKPVRRSGYTLTIFKKSADGAWRLYRDANLLI